MKILTGFTAGVASLVAIVHALLAGFGASDVRKTLSDFASSLPLSTRLVVSPVWLWGVPLALLAGTASAWFGLARRPRLRLAACVTLTVAGLAALWFTRWALAEPLKEMGENLRAE